MKNGRGLILIAGIVLCQNAQAYELETHAYLTYRAFTRSQLADPQGALQKRLGLDRLDTQRAPFAYELPFTSTSHHYFDEKAETSPLVPQFYSRATQSFERRKGFRDLVEASFYPSPVTVPAADSVYFDASADASVRFEQTLPAWLMRGAVREDDYGLVSPMGTEEGAERDPDPWGEILRVSRHFYDPIHNIPLTIPVIPPDEKATDWALGLTDALDASETENTVRRQHFSLLDYYNNLYWAMTLERPHAGGGTRTAADRKSDFDERRDRFATSMKALGHVVHLLQDMAQPQHTRNDQHLGISKFIKKRLFEPYTETRVTQNFSSANQDYSKIVTEFYGYPPPPAWFPRAVYTGSSGEYPIPTFSHAVQFYTTRNPGGSDAVAQRKGMADFSNRNFFSIGTLPGNSTFNYPSQDVTSFALVATPDAMVIGNQHPMDFFLTQPVQDSFAPSFHDTLPTYTNGQIPLVALSQLRDLSDLTSASVNVVTLGLTNYVAMADVNIPRAVAYSAGMMNFALRGELEVSVPTDRTVAVLNQGSTHTVNAQGYPCAGSSAFDGCPIFGFEKVRVKVRNTTPAITDAATGSTVNQGTGSASGTATIVAVARYHRNTCYDPSLTGERVQGYPFSPAGISPPLCGAGQSVRTDYQEISTSAPLTVAAGELDNLSVGVDKFFDFSSDPIPVNATDLFIQVVYRGPLGSEASSIAVGILDVREPTFVTFWNNTDYWWNGTSTWNAYTTTYPRDAAQTFWACTGVPPALKQVFRYDGSTGSPAMGFPLSGVTGIVRLGIVFPPPDAGSANKIIRGVPDAYDVAGIPQIPYQSPSTKGMFRQANMERVSAATLAAPVDTCSTALPTTPEYWCMDVVRRRRGQIMGMPAQPLYLKPAGANNAPIDFDDSTMSAFTGLTPLASGTVLFNSNATLTDCPAQPSSIEQPADEQHGQLMELIEEAESLGIDMGEGQ